jgi:hypothetical protein
MSTPAVEGYGNRPEAAEAMEMHLLSSKIYA